MKEEDKILRMFFEKERWTYAIDKGVDKDIDKGELIRMADERVRMGIARAMRDGKYMVSPPHTAQIPKDNGEFRTVYVNEALDRIILSIANDLLFELAPGMIHPSCKSYLKGTGCGKVVKEASKAVDEMRRCPSFGGWKADLSKYFDSVPLQYIDDAFDKVEQVHGKSALMDVLRKYYHCDLYFDHDGRLASKYQSLKQGCPVASWLADVILYGLDEQLSSLDGYYVRYSDDMLFVGKDYMKAMETLQSVLHGMGMKLNPKKVEYLAPQRWFKFLGYSIRGSMISLSSSRIKTFQHEIEKRTVRCRDTTLPRALNSVNRYLYKGDGTHSWATQVLPVVNVGRDIDELNMFVMDCLRAVSTGKRKVGGLGYVQGKPDGCISRGTGRNVTANRRKTAARLEGFRSLGCMRKALMTSRPLYNTLVSQM